MIAAKIAPTILTVPLSIIVIIVALLVLIWQKRQLNSINKCKGMMERKLEAAAGCFSCTGREITQKDDRTIRIIWE